MEVTNLNMNVPALALRGLTVFPHMTLTFDVERPISIAALERAMDGDQNIFLVTQKDISANLPEEDDLYEFGTLSHITQVLRISPNAVRVMVEGRQRARLRRLWQTEPYMQVNIDGFLRFADYFFDGLFADWAVMDRISQSRSSVSGTINQINQTLKRISGIEASLDREITALEQQIDELIVEA